MPYVPQVTESLVKQPVYGKISDVHCYSAVNAVGSPGQNILIYAAVLSVQRAPLPFSEQTRQRCLPHS